MKREVSPKRKKIAALTILFAVVGAGYGWMVNPLLDRYRDNREQIMLLEERLVEYQRIAGNEPVLKRILTEQSHEMRQALYFLRNGKHALASAELQELIRDKIGESRGRLISSQAYEVSTTKGRETVTVDVRLQGDIHVLQSVLYRLANARPFVFVDELMVTSIRSRAVGRLNPDASKDEKMLDIRIKVSAYLRSESPRI